jgi:hypothetical protein
VRSKQEFAMPTKTKPSIVFAHGLWADGSCFSKLIPTLVADLFNQKVDGTAWKAKPSWYVLANQDQTVHPELQRFVSKRMKAATTEVASSHVPMLSKPDTVLEVIRTAVSAVQKS